MKKINFEIKSTQRAILSGGFWDARPFGAGMAPRPNKGTKNTDAKNHLEPWFWVLYG